MVSWQWAAVTGPHLILSNLSEPPNILLGGSADNWELWQHGEYCHSDSLVAQRDLDRTVAKSSDYGVLSTVQDHRGAVHETVVRQR